jgi:hypothetical protein
MKAKLTIVFILLLVTFGVYLNQIEKRAVDYSKIPMKVEESKGFQRWITNLKNKDFEIEADEFRMVEENEIYNTKWMKVYSSDNEEELQRYQTQIGELRDLNKIALSPSERQFVDYRDINRNGYKPNEAHFYGLREDKIIDARIVDCSLKANCYFDRAWFLEDSNDVVVISEFSRDIDKKEENPEVCLVTDVCTYTIKLHVIDLLKNSRLIYESKPFDIILEEIKPEL